MNSLICGSGFGLYGYLPAIYKFSSKIYLNKKYQKKFYSRNELASYESKIIWYNKIEKIIYKINYLIIAKRPIDQIKIIKLILKNKNQIHHIFLEKPIAISPKKSLSIIETFYKKKINYSIGFFFEYLKWYKLIKKVLDHSKKKNNIYIKWDIKNKSDELNNWKYNSKNGGGLIRYYGIHFIKLFSDLNFNKIKINRLTNNYWKFSIEDKKNNIINVFLKYSKISNFSYKINNSSTKKFDNPFFNKIEPKLIDPRCFYIKKYIRKNLFNYDNTFINTKKFLNLWNKIENEKNNAKKHI